MTLEFRKSGYPLPELVGPTDIPHLLASLIVERVGRRNRRLVDEASPSTPVDVASKATQVSTAPIEIPRSPAASLLPRQDEYVIGLSSPFAKCEAEKPLKKKKKPTVKIKVKNVSVSRSVIRSPEGLDSSDSSKIHCNQLGNVKNYEGGVEVVVPEEVEVIVPGEDEVLVPEEDEEVVPEEDEENVREEGNFVGAEVCNSDVPVDRRSEVPKEGGMSVRVGSRPDVPESEVAVHIGGKSEVCKECKVVVPEAAIPEVPEEAEADEEEVPEEPDSNVPEADEEEVPEEPDSNVPKADEEEVPEKGKTNVLDDEEGECEGETGGVPDTECVDADAIEALVMKSKKRCVSKEEVDDLCCLWCKKRIYYYASRCCNGQNIIDIAQKKVYNKRVIDLYAMILMDKVSEKGPKILGCRLFKKRFGPPNIHVPNWNDFFKEIRVMIDNDMLKRIVYVPLFTRNHWHYLVVNEPECVITHFDSKAKLKNNKKEARRVVQWIEEYLNYGYFGYKFSDNWRFVDAKGFPQENDETEDYGLYMLQGVTLSMHGKMPL
ncbi:hypothetical protein ZOSMA_248G00090 [Zostera marina]|uniref:Ubiquitin-like protease family profile domain-containing protein n=1 Tax=Zostera marina TaxID=29655 RepID=A0A0K9PIW7_ZOSMR|nr:hypothetical protein ZOSMA_248G00090 [Zostera marina]